MSSFFAAVEKADRAWKKFGAWLALFGSFLLMASVWLVVADVTGRYVFLKPIIGATESLTLALPYVAFLAMAYTLAQGGHVRVTLLFDRIPRTARLLVDNFTCLVALLFLGIITFYGSMFFWESFEVNEEMMAQIFLPAWVGKFSLPLGFAIFGVQFLLRLLMNFGRLSGDIKEEEVVSEELLAASS